MSDIKTEFEYTLDEPLLVKYTFGDSDISEFEEGEALAVLLIENVIFLNSHWWNSKDREKTKMYNSPPENPWPEEACKTISLNVNCNDVFAWGCADAEECYHDDLEDVFNHWQKDNVWGAAIWCIKKRKMLPQKPVYDDIMKAGIWNLDEMGLELNFYDEALKENRKNK